MDNDKLKAVLEALFAASDKPLSVNHLFELLVGDIDSRSRPISKPGSCGCGNRNRHVTRAH